MKMVARIEQSGIRHARSTSETNPNFASLLDVLLPGRRFGARAVALLDIVDHQRLEVGGDPGSAQGAEFFAVDEHRRGPRFAAAPQRDADSGMLGFAGACDDS